jgi:hypothetical protein
MLPPRALSCLPCHGCAHLGLPGGKAALRPRRPEHRSPRRRLGASTLIDDRGIEPRSTAVSERRLTSQPVVASQHVSFRAVAAAKPTPSGISPAAGGDPSGAIPLDGIALANETSLAGRIRTSVPHPRKVALGSAELRRGALSAGVEPASPGRQPSRATRRVRERVPPRGRTRGPGGSCGSDNGRLHGSARSRIRSCGFSICRKNSGAPGNRTPLGWLQATIVATKSPIEERPPGLEPGPQRWQRRVLPT